MNKAQINTHQRVIYKVRTNRIVPVALLHGVSEHVAMGADLEEAVLRRAECSVAWRCWAAAPSSSSAAAALARLLCRSLLRRATAWLADALASLGICNLAFTPLTTHPMRRTRSGKGWKRMD